MRLLVINEEVKKRVVEVKRFADENPITVTAPVEEVQLAGDKSEFVTYIPDGYRVVYSIENQPKGKVRHLSVSLVGNGSLPSPHSVEAIIELFGFEKKLHDCKIYLEEIEPEHHAMNVLEFVTD